MDDDLVGFPEEANDTQFQADSNLDDSLLRQTLQEFVDYESISMMTADEFVFFIENEHFDGLIKLYLSNDHVTVERPDRHPDRYAISGEAVLLDIDGEELDVPLQVDGELDFSMHRSGGPLGTLTVWRRKPERIGLRDAS